MGADLDLEAKIDAMLEGQARICAMLAELLGERLETASQPTVDDLALFLEVASIPKPGEAFSVAEILTIAEVELDLGAALDRIMPNGRGRPNRLGLWLERMQRHPVDGMRLRRAGMARGSNAWAIDLLRE
jgi:hypothetical protein